MVASIDRIKTLLGPHVDDADGAGAFVDLRGVQAYSFCAIARDSAQGVMADSAT